jgi:hypothetical protein
MNTPPTNDMPAFRWITIIAAVVLVLLFAALLGAIWLAGLVPGLKSPISISQTPTATPRPTAPSAPHVLVYAPPSTAALRAEDFSSGLDHWSLYYPVGKMELIDGRIVLQANRSNSIAVALNPDFITAGAKYYVQADFSTDVTTSGAYGLVFGASYEGGTFYLFGCNPQFQSCRLLRHTRGAWEPLLERAQAELRALPEPNTLSVYFDNGRMELYTNGNLLTSYIDDAPFHSTGVGALVSSPGFRLFADNFFGYSEK